MTVSVTRQKCGYFNQATQLNSITPALITILAIGLIILTGFAAIQSKKTAKLA